MQGDACVSGLEFLKGSIKNVNASRQSVPYQDLEVSPTGFSDE